MCFDAIVTLSVFFYVCAGCEPFSFVEYKSTFAVVVKFWLNCEKAKLLNQAGDMLL